MVLDLQIKSLEYTAPPTKGNLSKEILLIGSKKYIIKGSSIYGKEPYSEYIAYKLAKQYGFNVPKTYLVSKSFRKHIKCYGTCEHLSLSEYVEESIVPLGDYLRFNSSIKSLEELIYKHTSIRKGLLEMFLLDMLIANTDRHINNIFITNDLDQKYIIDNGASSLFDVNDSNLKHYHPNHNIRDYKWFNEFKQLLNLEEQYALGQVTKVQPDLAFIDNLPFKEVRREAIKRLVNHNYIQLVML